MIVCRGRLGRRPWWRRAAAMLAAPASRRMVMTRLLAQAGHDAGAAGRADLGAVLVEVHVMDPVQAVFDAPVTADDGG